MKWALALLALAMTVAPSNAADSAKGNFHFGKVRFQPVDVLAYQQAVDGKPVTLIVMTDFKIDRTGVMDEINTMGALLMQINEKQGGNFVTVSVSALDKCGLSGFLGTTMQQIDLGSSFPGKTSVGASRVAGECFTKEPGKMFDDTYDFRLSYDAALTVIPKPTPLTAGGGEPGAAYAALIKAIQAADWNAAHLHLRQEEVPATPPKASEMREYFHGVGLNYPKTVTVTGGLIKGDRANLDITGKDSDGKKIKGVVAIRKVAGNWRVLEQNMFFDE